MFGIFNLHERAYKHCLFTEGVSPKNDLRQSALGKHNISFSVFRSVKQFNCSHV